MGADGASKLGHSSACLEDEYQAPPYMPLAYTCPKHLFEDAFADEAGCAGDEDIFA